MTLDSSSKPHIGFDNGSARLSYARPAPAGGGWLIEDVATAGGGHALALDSSNNALIAFHDSAARSLKYAHRTGVNAWTITTIDTPDAADTSGDAGKYPSLALDADGNPRVRLSLRLPGGRHRRRGQIRYLGRFGVANRMGRSGLLGSRHLAVPRQRRRRPHWLLRLRGQQRPAALRHPQRGHRPVAFSRHHHR